MNSWLRETKCPHLKSRESFIFRTEQISPIFLNAKMKLKAVSRLFFNVRKEKVKKLEKTCAKLASCFVRLHK